MYYKDRLDYYIYLHISPSNKYYVGYSCQKNPNVRWRNGNGYIKNPLIWPAIKKYGWDNFQHKILKSGLSFEEANYWERYYIKQYKSNDRKYGYNLTDGGSNPNQSDAAKLKNKLAHIGKRFYRSSIYQYDENGNLLNFFRSYKEAEEFTGINLYRVATSCNKSGIVVKPIRCCFSKNKLSINEVKKRFYKSTCKKYVYQYDLKTLKLINSFDSLISASKATKMSEDTICISCSNSIKKDKGKAFPKGYIFRHYQLSYDELKKYSEEYEYRQQQIQLNKGNNQYGKCKNKNTKS